MTVISCYILFSAADGPDFLAHELDLVKNINLAVKEERYEDAGMIPFYLTTNIIHVPKTDSQNSYFFTNSLEIA